jgi:hypothetical protein
MAYRPPHGAPKGHVLSDVEIAALRNITHHQVLTPPSSLSDLALLIGIG